jgi:hypothetical protein
MHLIEPPTEPICRDTPTIASVDEPLGGIGGLLPSRASAGFAPRRPLALRWNLARSVEPDNANRFGAYASGPLFIRRRSGVIGTETTEPSPPPYSRGHCVEDEFILAAQNQFG